MKKLMVFFLILLTACTTNYSVTNPSRGLDSYNQDNYQCELSARQNTIPQRYGIAFDDIRYTRENNDIYLSCMRSKGYVLTPK